MFNREYQRRAARQALERVGVDLVQDNSGFYRPERRPWPGTRVAKVSQKNRPRGLQLELFQTEQPAMQVSRLSTDPERPLFDLFPEAYQS